MTRSFLLVHSPARDSIAKLVAPVLAVALTTSFVFRGDVVSANGSCSTNSTIDGADTVVTISDVGTCTWSPPSGVAQVDVLVVGGGGGGGGGSQVLTTPADTATSGGGGGGGSVTLANNVAVSNNVTITVGEGGAAGSPSPSATHIFHGVTGGQQGGQSAFGSLTAPGGGGGSAGTFNDQNRLSGDGGGSQRNINGTITATTGGVNVHDGAGGGAGAGANGSDGTDLPSRGGNGGFGGVGVSTSISGVSAYYGSGGGGGGVWDSATDGEGGLAGVGGGGNGNRLPASPAAAGTDGTGGGGGGGGYTNGTASAAGARGGHGVVIIRYVTPTTTTTETPTTVAPSPIPVVPVSAGNAAMVMGSQTVTVTQQVETRGRGATIAAGPIEMSVRARTASNSSIPLTPNNALVAPKSGQLLTGGSGVASSSTVTLTLFSNPVRLGETVADASGNFSANVTIPNNVPTGSHTLRIQGTTNSGQVFALDMGVIVKSPAAALGAHPLVSAKQRTVRGKRMIQVTVTKVQKSCTVGITVGNRRATTKASRSGTAVVLIPSTGTSSSKLRATVKASVSGKGCDKVSVSRRYR